MKQFHLMLIQADVGGKRKKKTLERFLPGLVEYQGQYYFYSTKLFINHYYNIRGRCENMGIYFVDHKLHKNFSDNWTKRKPGKQKYQELLTYGNDVQTLGKHYLRRSSKP